MKQGLIDSTLREGGQAYGIAFSLAQKKEIFAGLCRVGIEEIEVGLATPLDDDLPELISFCREHDIERRLGLWCRCRRDDIHFAAFLAPDVLSLSIPVSDLHIEMKFGRDRELALAAAKSAVLAARRLGFKEISLGLEDATRADHSFLMKMAQEAIMAGVDRLRLADTVGIASPLEIVRLVQGIKSLGPVAVGVHMHNDFGLATANSLAALEAARADSSSRKNPKTDDPLPESRLATAPCSLRKSFASLMGWYLSSSTRSKSLKLSDRQSSPDCNRLQKRYILRCDSPGVNLPVNKA